MAWPSSAMPRHPPNSADTTAQSTCGLLCSICRPVPSNKHAAHGSPASVVCAPDTSQNQITTSVQVGSAAADAGTPRALPSCGPKYVGSNSGSAAGLPALHNVAGARDSYGPQPRGLQPVVADGEQHLEVGDEPHAGQDAQRDQHALASAPAAGGYSQWWRMANSIWK